ncbi:hypothetical protein ACIBO2_18865 [Nonomuraea sp. NPDC050022]|uniref:hypothetical protein n=1 Tax=Nonomuraea sp. NPDC050022 TaxID=3364358 RepID=UPI0037BC3020
MTRRRTPRTSVIRLTTGRTARTLLHPYGHRKPVLALDFGSACVQVTARGPVTADDLTFARQLAHEAARYARLVERTYRAMISDHEMVQNGTAA